MVAIRTSGDEWPGGAPAASPSGEERSRYAVPAATAAGPSDKSRFVKEIEDALLREDIDLAVHSAKDVPGELPDGLAIVGVPERADPRDSLCGASEFDALPEGAVVGTASLRRRAQLLAARPDLDVRDLRGNVDTRLRRLDEDGFAAIVIAAAGLARLGRDEGEPISIAVMTPAPGQGCLALEARAGHEKASELAGRLTHRDSLVCLTAERAVVQGLGATCHTPVGALAHLLDGGKLCLDVFAGMPDGSTWVRDTLVGEAGDPAALGRAVTERMLLAGAGELLEAAEHALQ